MASPSEEDISFRAAFSAFKAANTEDERSTAGRLLRAELERKALSLEAARKRETRSREREFMEELARLEEQLRHDVNEKDKVTAIRKACVEMCLKTLESDPAEANLYANLILSWSTKTQSSSPDWCMGRPLREKIQEAKEKATEEILEAVIPNFLPPSGVRVVAVRVAKMKPEDIQRMSANMQVILNNRGVSIPPPELSAALVGSVRLERNRDATMSFWKDAIGIFTGTVGVVGAVVSTLQALKHCNSEDNEPVINCRHHLPDGWYF